VDAQLDEPVGEQNARALLNVFRQGLEVVPTSAAVPGTSRGVMTSCSPAFSSTG